MRWVAPPPAGTYAELVKAGHVEPVEPDSYKWCQSSTLGIGGYPCGLWLLFHTLLSNTDKNHAPLVSPPLPRPTLSPVKLSTRALR